MILVSVGTQKFPFDRLIRSVDELVEKGVIDEEVCMQIGTSTYTPKHCSYQDYIPAEIMKKKLQECSLLITHAGVGSILEACTYGKPVIVLPRLKKYMEHVDDHQVEIARAFSEQGYIYYCNDEKELTNAVHSAPSWKYSQYQSSNQKIVSIIDKFIQQTN